MDWLATMGRAGMIWVMALRRVPSRSELALIVNQIYAIGVRSLLIVALSGFSIGAVIALQFYTQLSRFGAEESVGLGLALVVLRELGPVVKNPNYRGISATFWRSLAGVGDPDTFEILGTPNCGKGEPNQAIRVGHASPACLFRSVDAFGGA